MHHQNYHTFPQIVEYGLARWESDQIKTAAQDDFDYVPLSHNLISNSYMGYAYISKLHRFIWNHWSHCSICIGAWIHECDTPHSHEFVIASLFSYLNGKKPAGFRTSTYVCSGCKITLEAVSAFTKVSATVKYLQTPGPPPKSDQCDPYPLSIRYLSVITCSVSRVRIATTKMASAVITRML